MFLPITPCFLVLSAALIHHSLAAPAYSTNASARLSIPPTPGFSLSQKSIFPRQPMFNASTMLLLTCQMLYDYSQLPWSAAAQNTEQIDSNICILIANTFGPKKPHLRFQNRHAMWGLWLAAMQQAKQYNRQPGVFVLSISSIGASTKEVAIITYSRDPEPYNMATTLDNHTTDPTSRSNEPPDISYINGPPRASSTNETAINSTAHSTAAVSPYTVVINQIGARNLVMVDVFDTICQVMIQRASMPDRNSLTREWFYTCQPTGYKLGLRPPQGASGSPPYAAIMGGLANLLKAMHEAKQDKEIAFNVQSQNGEVILQGMLVVEGADEVTSGISFA